MANCGQLWSNCKKPSDLSASRFRNSPVSAVKLRRLALRHQGLLGKRRLGAGLDGAAKALERLGYVQIDTISVVARAHHHTFFTRVSGYRSDMPNRLVAQRRAFEYWCHAAAYLPMRDYRFALPMMRATARGELWNHAADPKTRRWVLDRIRAEGALFARDFAQPPRQSKGKGWWDWKPAKRALERLYMEGELMISERAGFEKRYELAERFLPADVDTREPTVDAHADHVIDIGLAAHGFATAQTLAYFRRDARVRDAVRRRLAERVLAGGLSKRQTPWGTPVYAQPATFDAATPPPAAVARILSPFDNAMIQRQRGREVFGFDYAIECYLPAPKRRYGYFALPILFADRFAGRMDCKAHRQEGRFDIKALHLENPENMDAFWPAFAAAAREYAAFTGCPEVRVAAVSPARFTQTARRLFA